MSFVQATAVEPLGDGRFSARIHPGWDIRGIANGGYLMAIAGRAILADSDGRRLVSITGHFMNPAGAGPVDIHIEHLKTGRTFTTSRAVVSSEGRPLVSVTGSLATSDPSEDGPSLLAGSPPEVPPPERCVRATASGGEPFPPPIVDRIDLRIHPEDVGGALGRPTGQALFRGWFRLLDDEPVDEPAIVLSTDIFPPAIFNSGHPMTWTPTLDLTVHVRDPGPHEWLLCKLQTRFVTGGFLEEDGEIWDAGGNLVALSRQLAIVGRR